MEFFDLRAGSTRVGWFVSDFVVLYLGNGVRWRLTYK